MFPRSTSSLARKPARFEASSVQRTARLSTRGFASTAQRSTALFPNYLVTPKQLAAVLDNGPPRLVPISAAWFLPNAGTTGHASFVKSHIPGSRFFDLDAVSDRSSPYPHMLPSSEAFGSHMSRLGLTETDTIVVYDSPELGLFSAPRVAWTFRVFGHKGGVHVLNNYKAWVEAGLPTESGEGGRWEVLDYRASELDKSMVASFEDVRSLVERNKGRDEEDGVQILDARSKGRFDGTEDEPRKGLSSGAMPGARNVPFSDLLDPTTKALRTGDELRKWFVGQGIDGQKPIVTTCGTGVTASVVDAALKEAGLGDGQRRVYDGSWTEWAQRVKDGEGLIVKKS